MPKRGRLSRLWPAMSEAVLGRVEWSYGDSNPEFNHAMVA